MPKKERKGGRNNTWNTPYLFNAKELDEETGLYYYGARYYDARISLWLSADPLQEKYPNVSSYAYTFQNPIRYIDPSGMEGEPGDGIFGFLSSLSDKIERFLGINQPSNQRGTDRARQDLANLKAGQKRTEQLAAAVNTTNEMLSYGSPLSNTATVLANSTNGRESTVGEKVFASVEVVGLAVSFVGAGWASEIPEVATKSATAVQTGTNFQKILTPIDEFDAAVTIYRGTTGSETASSIMFATENASVAASYVKNGGQVVSYRVSQFGLKSLESSGQLTYKTGMHGIEGIVSKEYVFRGKELIEYLNSIATSLK